MLDSDQTQETLKQLQESKLSSLLACSKKVSLPAIIDDCLAINKQLMDIITTKDIIDIDGHSYRNDIAFRLKAMELYRKNCEAILKFTDIPFALCQQAQLHQGLEQLPSIETISFED